MVTPLNIYTFLTSPYASICLPLPLPMCVYLTTESQASVIDTPAATASTLEASVVNVDLRTAAPPIAPEVPLCDNLTEELK